MKKTFSIKTLFNQAWSDYKSNWKTFILIGIIFALVGGLGNLGMSVDPITGYLTNSPLISIVAWLLQVFIGLGFIQFLLNIIDEKDAKIENLFHGAHSIQHFIYFVIVGLLVSVLTVLGTVLFIIPGIVLATGLLFSKYFMAEEKTDIVGSLRSSWNATMGHKWKIFWLMIVIVFFNLASLFTLFIGLVITIPMTYIIYARLYRTLTSDDAEAIEVIEVLEGDKTEE